MVRRNESFKRTRFGRTGDYKPLKGITVFIVGRPLVAVACAAVTQSLFELLHRCADPYVARRGEQTTKSTKKLKDVFSSGDRTFNTPPRLGGRIRSRGLAAFSHLSHAISSRPLGQPSIAARL